MTQDDDKRDKLEACSAFEASTLDSMRDRDAKCNLRLRHPWPRRSTLGEWSATST